MSLLHDMKIGCTLLQDQYIDSKDSVPVDEGIIDMATYLVWLISYCRLSGEEARTGTKIADGDPSPPMEIKTQRRRKTRWKSRFLR